MVFKDLVKKHFGFLVTDYGFVELQEALGYKLDSLEIEFYSGKGEVDIVLFVRKQDEIFKPFVSRSFDLLKVAREISKVDENKNIKELGERPDTNDMDGYLQYCSKVLGLVCADVIRGDLTVLQNIHLARRKNA